VAVARHGSFQLEPFEGQGRTQHVAASRSTGSTSTTSTPGREPGVEEARGRSEWPPPKEAPPSIRCSLGRPTSAAAGFGSRGLLGRVERSPRSAERELGRYEDQRSPRSTERGFFQRDQTGAGGGQRRWSAHLVDQDRVDEGGRERLGSRHLRPGPRGSPALPPRPRGGPAACRRSA
jgi:hypothetical protein